MADGQHGVECNKTLPVFSLRNAHPRPSTNGWIAAVNTCQTKSPKIKGSRQSRVCPSRACEKISETFASQPNDVFIPWEVATMGFCVRGKLGGQVVVNRGNVALDNKERTLKALAQLVSMFVRVIFNRKERGSCM